MADLDNFLASPLADYLITALIMVSVVGVTFTLLMPLFSKDKLGKRKEGLVQKNGTQPNGRSQKVDVTARRKTVQDQLNAMEAAQAAKKKNADKPIFADWIGQAGLSWSKPKFYFISVVCGCIVFTLSFFSGQPLWISIALLFVGVFGVPRFYVSRRRKKRFNQFLDEFPNAVDIIVRGIKSGMPLGDCMHIAASEAKDPVGLEFSLILDKMQMGIPLAEAIQNMPKRVPLQETNFLAIVIAIQAQAGGSLSDALNNLSKTLRQRKEMKGKIRAVSQEAKSSAAIIGSLPFLVTIMLYLIAPSYIRLLVDTDIGLILIAVGLTWMTLGILVMRKMIDFKI
ncbi:Bacterial type II secretion system protein F domain protein [Pseudovibrio sp. Ad46]|uniref:type II secretion system F family protein n=1 Tax=unclassified Pseudovibrio TaxID=2627060 RepID=UPI0007AE9FD6|nr:MULTISPECIES: type II secretion system F family protein [unclassified Pseudovibrio]KZK93868.1 Bacterial type II secretion system protein F domain protein [Pseudovibrio sp. Ad46]KZL00082.1 Bacterial type II secretion system protein F domain protein [Pseudovibrio sp. Ad5]